MVLSGYNRYKMEGEWFATSMMTMFFDEPADAHYPGIKLNDPGDVALLNALLVRTRLLMPQIQPRSLTMNVTKFYGMSHTLYNRRDVIAFEIEGTENGEERVVRLKAVFATGKEESKRLSKTVRLAIAPELARLEGDVDDGWAGVIMK